MAEQVTGFDWDGGNWPKCGKHGVGRDEIEEIFHTDPLLIDDPFLTEKRIRAIGTTLAGRHVFVVFVFRLKAGVRLIRPLSARYMHKKEVERYERRV